MTAKPTGSRRGQILAIVAALVLLVVLGGTWYLFLRPAGPAPVTLGSAVPGGPAASMDASATGAPSADPTGAAPGEGDGGPSADGIEGTWTVDPSVGSFGDFSGSFVGYRVRETLASIGATEAVGRTPDVTGSVTIEGTSITAADFTADLTTLQSDERFRDGQLRRQALETDEFPSATFVLTAPVDLGSVPAEGATIDVAVAGDLTLHGVTRAVEIPLQARLQDGVVTIAGSLSIAFADFGIAKPVAMAVISVEDNGVLELQLQLTRG